MGRVEDGQPVHDLGMVHRGVPGDGSAPVVADHQRGLGTALSDETADVVGQLVGGVGRDAGRPRRQVVAAHVGCDDAKSRRRERCDLLPPAKPELREAVQQNDQRPIAGLDVMQPRVVVELGVALTKFAGQEAWRLLFRHPTRAAGVVLARAHCDLPWGCFTNDGYAFPISWHHPVCSVRRGQGSSGWRSRLLASRPFAPPSSRSQSAGLAASRLPTPASCASG